MDNNGDNGGENTPTRTGQSIEFPLGLLTDETISGTASFFELTDNSIDVELSVTNTTNLVVPANIRTGTAAEGGDVFVALNPVNRAGTSSTNINNVSFSEIFDFDGYVEIGANDAIVAQGDIGQNALTGEFIEYPLPSISDPNISGIAVFSQRNNGNTLIVVRLENTIPGVMSPTHLHMDPSIQGPVVIDLNLLDGTTGISASSVSTFDDGTPMTYDQLISFNGYVNVHESVDNLTVLIAEGDVGSAFQQ